MKNRLIIYALALTFLAGLGDALLAEQPTRLRVVSYNIHHGEGTDRKLDLPRIAKVITDAQADIVALQEVDQKTERTEQVDQPAELARLTGLNVVFGGNLKFQGGWYGNAVLSRFPVSMKNHPLPQLREGETRGMIEADIQVPGLPRPLKFLATHFDYRPDEAERIASAELVGKVSQNWGDRPALLAGDLNALPDSQTLKILLQDWQMANDEPQGTFPSDGPTRQIDYILLRPAGGWKVIEFRVLDEAVASDHRGILAVLEWDEARTRD